MMSAGAVIGSGERFESATIHFSLSEDQVRLTQHLDALAEPCYRVGVT